MSCKDGLKSLPIRLGAVLGSLLCQAVGLCLGSTFVSAAAVEVGKNTSCGSFAHNARPATLECFDALMQERRIHPERAADIDAQIEAIFTQRLAVMVMDMVGFSHTTAEVGIIPVLAQIYRIRELTVPVIEAHGGRILKLEADNVYAVFPTSEQALMAMQTVLYRLNEENLHASIGIGYGDVLVLGERDVFGNEMNLASKLGEDLAGDDDLLMTEAAWNALPRQPAADALSDEISGLTVPFYRISHSNP
ncbi:MAG TPA: adenylate/guanylate cyclase domain-containing protein [Leptolyngbyaceae cyanobacterium]